MQASACTWHGSQVGAALGTLIPPEIARLALISRFMGCGRLK